MARPQLFYRLLVELSIRTAFSMERFILPKFFQQVGRWNVRWFFAEKYGVVPAETGLVVESSSQQSMKKFAFCSDKGRNCSVPKTWNKRKRIQVLIKKKKIKLRYSRNREKERLWRKYKYFVARRNPNAKFRESQKFDRQKIRNNNNHSWNGYCSGGLERKTMIWENRYQYEISSYSTTFFPEQVAF